MTDDSLQVKRQVEKITASPVLHGSEGLCRLLHHLADAAIQSPKTPLDELRLATEVLGRRPDFNPKTDSAVRVQVSRLRSKLAEYYSTIGSDDEIVLDLPKRGTGLTIQKRNTTLDQVPAAVPSNPWKWAAVVSALIALLLAGLLLRTGKAPGNSLPELEALGFKETDLAELRQFWSPFLQNPAGPLIVYGNGEFTGSPYLGMKLAPYGGADGNTIRSYTGTGEVMAVHALDRVFAAMLVHTRVKRAGLLTLDDAQHNDIIFVGSPIENPPLQDLPSTAEFTFRPNPKPSADDYFSSVVNLHPKSGEPSLFVSDKANPPATDYAVIELIFRNRHAVLTLAGTTTFGTEAAVEYVSNPDTLHGLNGKAAFGAVLQVHLKKGVSLSSEVIALHLR